MTLTCAKCKRPYDLPAVLVKDRPYVCDACWKVIMQEAAERIKIKVGK